MPYGRLDEDVRYMTAEHRYLAAEAGKEITEHRDHALSGRAQRVLVLALVGAREGAQIAKTSAPQQALTGIFCTWGEIAYSPQNQKIDKMRLATALE